MNHQEHTYPIKLTNLSADLYCQIYQFLGLNDWLNLAVTSKGLKICPHRSLIIVHDRFVIMMSKKFGPRGLQLMKLLRGINLVDVTYGGEAFYHWAFENSFGDWPGTLEISASFENVDWVDELTWSLNETKQWFTTTTLEMGRPRRVHSVKLYDRSARGDTLVEIMVRQNMTVRNTWVEYLEFMSGVTSSGRLHLVNPYTYKEKLLTPNKNLKRSADVERKCELSRAGWSYLF